jgi:amino acid adenylation domain-containing protein
MLFPNAQNSCLLWFIGSLNQEILQTSLNELINRHEILRASLTELHDQSALAMQPSITLQLTKLNASNAEIRQHIQSENSVLTDFTTGFLLRAKLLCLANDKHVLLLTFHSLAFDGWTKDVFLSELLAIYQALNQGRHLPEVSMQYEAIINERARLLSYWKKQLTGATVLQLPTDRPQTKQHSTSVVSQFFTLPAQTVSGLKTLSQTNNVTLFTTLLAALQVLLHRYSQQDDIVISTPNISGRCLELEDLTGFFYNSLLLRTDVTGNPPFVGLLRRTRQVILDAYAHKAMPFKQLELTLNLKHDPLFQVMFSFNSIYDELSELNVSLAEFIQLDTVSSACPISLQLLETADGIQGVLGYQTDIFDATTIERFSQHYQVLLAGIVAHPEQRISDLPLLTEEERQTLLISWNDTQYDLADAEFIHHLFELQVERTPNAIAVVANHQTITYAELNARANQLAHYLISIGVIPETLLAICLPRSIEQIVCWLAVHKAGGAYAPFDPGYPEELLGFMLSDCSPMLVITDDKSKPKFDNIAHCPPLVNVSDVKAVWLNASTTNPKREEVGLTFNNLAYVIYTSGSTGKSKGVEILHQSFSNLMPWYINEQTHLTANDAVLVVTSMSFDVTQKVVFGPLLAGAKLVLVPEPFNPMVALELVLKERISMMTITPSGFYALIDICRNHELNQINRVFLGGEPMQAAKLLEIPAPRPEFYNNYGPTECTQIATYYHLSLPLEQYLDRSIPIGKPLRNLRIYILDAYQQLVPIGVPGEMYISGVGVARGYLNRPELTLERFLPDPFSQDSQARMYKTGDLVRWLADGNIEFLSRNDLQVKIRGYRIELNDIEAAILEHPDVCEAAVDVYQSAPDYKQLVAYLVTKENEILSTTELREFLKQKLPEFMLPAAYQFLPSLPLMPTGKLNRKALPPIVINKTSALNREHLDDLERLLVGIWEELLNLTDIDIHDNFFELGGHSLLAVKLMLKIRELCHFDISLGSIYQSPTIIDLKNIITQKNNHPWYSLVPIQTQGSRAPLFAIHTLTLHDLPRHLGKQQPLYFLRYGMAAEPPDRSIPLPNLEELASHYISEMQLIQPSGPYNLVGFSFGGVVAYEMANQLVAAGQQVNFLGLFDSHLDMHGTSLNMRALFPVNAGKLWARIQEKFNGLKVKHDKGKDFWPHFYTSAPDKACRKSYQPKKYPFQVTLFQAEQNKDSIFCRPFPEMAWRNFLGDNLVVLPVSGTHLYICKEPHVKTLAEKILTSMHATIK